MLDRVDVAMQEGGGKIVVKSVCRVFCQLRLRLHQKVSAKKGEGTQKAFGQSCTGTQTHQNGIVFASSKEDCSNRNVP